MPGPVGSGFMHNAELELDEEIVEKHGGDTYVDILEGVNLLNAIAAESNRQHRDANSPTKDVNDMQSLSTLLIRLMPELRKQ